MNSPSAIRVSLPEQTSAPEPIVQTLKLTRWQRFRLETQDQLRRLPNGLKLSLAAIACSVFALTFSVTNRYLSPDAQDVARKQQVEERFQQQVEQTTLATNSQSAH